MKIKRKINFLDFSFPVTNVASLSLQNIFWFAYLALFLCGLLSTPAAPGGSGESACAVPCSDKLTHLWCCQQTQPCRCSERQISLLL